MRRELSKSNRKLLDENKVLENVIAKKNKEIKELEAAIETQKYIANRMNKDLKENKTKLNKEKEATYHKRF